MANSCNHRHENERGMALISALMISAIMLALGMAVVFSATSDTTTTRSQRVGQQAFFAADAGISIARRALATALEEEIKKIAEGKAGYGDGGFTKRNPPLKAGEFPDVQVVPDPVAQPNHQFYQNVLARATQLAASTSRKNKLHGINGTDFDVTFRPLAGSVSLIKQAGNSATAVESVSIRYSIQVTGTTESGGRASAVENGIFSTRIDLANGGGLNPTREFSFSGFGAFFDNGDTSASSALAAGSFSGPVHTNTHFAFQSSRTVQFRNIVTQVDNYIRYDSNNFSQGQKSIPSSDIKGIDISSEGYKRTGHVPLPENSFSQEYAVINGTGITTRNADGSAVDPPGKIPVDATGNPLPIIDSSGRVTAEALAANLRSERNVSPIVVSGRINNGVYVSSGDGSNITGAGIYVQGDASDIQLTTNGNEQHYIITQGSKVTTIKVNTQTNTTSIESSGRKTTYTGVPMDKSNPESPKPGVSLFVNGSINSLRGGTSGSTKKPAIAPSTALTITAQRDITITGDLKYANAVANSDGTPASGIDSIKNVLGIFTNDGNVELEPNQNYTGGSGLSLEIHAAIVAFNKTTSNDGSGEIEGSIVYTGSSNPSSTDKLKLVGSRVQSKINNIGYPNRDVFFDVRYAGGTFAPPFFPGTKYTIGQEPTAGEVAIASIETPKPTGMSWYRENNK